MLKYSCMPKENSFVSGFSESETKRIETHLERLLPHLNTEKVTVVGGLAIRYHLLKAGISYPPRQFNDLDLLAEHREAVKPDVKKDFLIYHYHPIPKGLIKFYIVLADPISRTKIDIFGDTNKPNETQRVKVKDYNLRIPSVEDQLVKTIFDLQRISASSYVDPKQFLDAKLLMQIADLKKADRFWKEKNFAEFPQNIEDAFNRSLAISQEHPDWVQEKPFRKSKPYTCQECRSTPDFPISPMEDVYRILRYVE